MVSIKSGQGRRFTQYILLFWQHAPDLERQAERLGNDFHLGVVAGLVADDKPDTLFSFCR